MATDGLNISMRTMLFIGLTVLGSTLLSLPAQAQSKEAETKEAETGELRGEFFCFPAKKVPKLIRKLETVKKSRRDIVDVAIEPKFLIKDGGDWPERFFIQTETDEIDIPIEKPSGLTPSFLDAAKAYRDGDICVQDATRADRFKDDEGLYFEMGLAPLFHNKSGTHSIAELKEGTKDGKSFYKKMIPSGLSLLLPDTKYLAVRYDDFRPQPSLFARIGEENIALQAETFKDLHIIPLETLEEMGATALVIEGGPYQLQPTVSPKLMRKYGWGAAKDEKTTHN